ncbi:UNVERIFIED_CONTAM: hypothetical protein GTU68_029135 [Idotea baltica]|nr:hypothetical protein [Idotea baltica]
MPNIQQRIEQLVEELKVHNHNYYVLAQPTISDYEFDKLLRELQDLETANPEWLRPDSPTLRVGGAVTKDFPSFTHIRSMLSLQNTYSREEVDDWHKSILKLTDGEDFTYIVQHKFDGVSLSAHYENGLFVRAVTRGDGVRGDEITANARTIPTVPLKVLGDDLPGDFEVRGEVLMHKEGFEKLNAERIENGDAALMNPRNATSGSLKMQDSAVVAKRPLTFYAYWVASDGGLPPTDGRQQELLHEAGFLANEHVKVCQSIDEVFDYINHWETSRHDLPYEIDGIVIKINEVRQREVLGNTSKFPRWAIAFKYASEQAETTLDHVNYQVGRTGTVTPVANLKPVLLAGTMVKRASLYNSDELDRLDLHEGDWVKVAKGGEIIPKVMSVITERRTEGAKKINFLTHCPECSTELKKDEGEVNWYCPNAATCPPQVKGRIEHFAARKGMYIDGLGEKIIDQLVSEGLISHFEDLYDLTFEQLMALERFAEKSARNLIASIEDSKKIPYPRVLFAMGIRYVGETVAKKLAKAFPHIDDLADADAEKIASIHEIGGRIAESVVEYFSDNENIARVAKLKAKGLQLELADSEKAVSAKLEGMSFVVSGTLENFNRTEIKKSIESNGGQVKGSVSSKTSYLLVGTDPGGSKVTKAEDNKVTIITEAEYLELIA